MLPARDKASWSKARPTSDYRFWRKNNAVNWYGVKAKVIQQPQLIKKISKRGEVHYQEVKD